MLDPFEGIANLADATFFYYLILEKLLPQSFGTKSSWCSILENFFLSKFPC